ncbi:MAG: ABC transporter permease [Candidatus Methanofastidiosia archaeon]|jgi:ABC-2 type transport system permease protein
MKTQRLLSFAKKDLKMMLRDPGSLFLALLFPVVLTIVFGISFGAIGGEQTTVYQVGAVTTGVEEEWSLTFVENLSSMEILNIIPYADSKSAQNDLIQGSIDAFIIIPESFGESCTSYVESPEDPTLWVQTTLEVYVDSGSMFATQAIPPLVQQVLVTTLTEDQLITPPIPIRIGIPSLVEAETLTMFDYMAPGIFPFAAIFMIMLVSQSFTVDRERGLLRRISTTPATSAEFILGHTLSNMVIIVVQVALVFVTAFMVGYSSSASTFGFFFAFIIVAVFGLCCVGFGLITAAVAKSPGAATGISFIFIIPLMFLGTFVSVGFSSVMQSAGKFVPSYYVTDALTSLLLRGAPVTSSSVILDFAVVTMSSIVVLILGVFIFERYGSSR